MVLASCGGDCVWGQASSLLGEGTVVGLELLLCLQSICSGRTKRGYPPCRTSRFHYYQIDVLHQKKTQTQPKPPKPMRP